MFQVCVISPGTKYFTKTKMAELERAGEDPGMSVSEDGRYFRVCYSNHPSLLETEKFIKHFSPSLITPLSLPARYRNIS